MELMQSYVNSSTNDVKDTITQLTSVDKNEAITADEQVMMDNLQAKFKEQSSVMTMVAVVIKALFALTSQESISQGDVVRDGFAPEGDAAQFWMLFGNDSLPQDEAFMAYSSELQTTLENEGALSPALSLIQDMPTNFSTQASSFASDTENDAFSFAAELANLAYLFTSDTETDAYNFATHMADLAYSFTMSIETDAYNFAMQGMEYGYLFASKGEEVGVMADRILWMAVQIGQMSDRIGEMADRIVYTEQLIVYTEMLILDFGLLIYGGMKMITNFMLTAMALILDRQWYTPQAEDQVLTVIGGSMSTMLEDMQEYSLAVLDNQSVLREVTLSALDWVGTNTEV